MERTSPNVDIALLVSTYERPGHLPRALESIARQQGVDGRFEVVVTDDGSTGNSRRGRRARPPRGFQRRPDDTPAYELPVVALPQRRSGGQPGSVLAVSRRRLHSCRPITYGFHLERRQPGVTMAGDCCRLDN